MSRQRVLIGLGLVVVLALVAVVLFFRPPRVSNTQALFRASAAHQPAFLQLHNTSLLPGEEWLERTAIVTLATGDEAGRHAVALVQSLRDVGTRIPHIVVLLSRGGLGSRMCQDMARQQRIGRQLHCDSLHTIPDEIVSQPYLDALAALGVVFHVVNPMPRTAWTNIPGGTQTFWGMAFNKLHVFGLYEFRKLLWMDSDTIVLRNVDHLLREPMFTAALTYDCCNGKHWGDMQVVRYMFGVPPNVSDVQPYWPTMEDGRHGYVPGVRLLPELAGMNQQDFESYLASRVSATKRAHEGFINSSWDGEHPPHVWRSLSVLYDQCVGMCECLPGRDLPDAFFSVHFSCIHHLHKPGWYESEHSFMNDLHRHGLSCTRRYYLTWWEAFTRAMAATAVHWHPGTEGADWFHGPAGGSGRLVPLWSGPHVPLHNRTHDEWVLAQRMADGV